MFNRLNTRVLKLLSSLLVCSLACQASAGFALKDTLKNVHMNVTSPGRYQDAAAGYWSGGGGSIRTKNMAIQPFSINAPSLSHSCGGIDVTFGSWSVISGGELITIVENIGSAAPAFAFHLGMKTYAPQIETGLKDFRNLSSQLSQAGIGQCTALRAGFAAMIPQKSAMYEQVCNEMASEGGADWGGQRTKCNTFKKQQEAAKEKQRKNPDTLMDNYNIFTKVANKLGIPKEMHASLMSMVGTIVVKNGVVIPYPSLANDEQSWSAHINGGSNVSMYTCNNSDCLDVGVNNNVNISKSASYAGKAKFKLDQIKIKMIAQTYELTSEEKGLIDSLSNSFQIFNHIMLEAASGASIIDPSSQLIARYMLMSHMRKITKDVQKGTYHLKNKQRNETTLADYEKSLVKLNHFADREWQKVMSDADRVNDRADKIYKMMISRGRG
jgi:conjugative transfer pilus assembly protein TraH